MQTARSGSLTWGGASSAGGAKAAALPPDSGGGVGEPDVERVLVCRGVHGDGFDVRLVQGADDAHGDLAPVRDQDAVEHQTASSGGAEETGSSSKRSWPNSTGSALRTWIPRTIPAASALISFISFIASRMQSARSEERRVGE